MHYYYIIPEVHCSKTYSPDMLKECKADAKWWAKRTNRIGEVEVRNAMGEVIARY
jgi:hypothetical protein